MSASDGRGRQVERSRTGAAVGEALRALARLAALLGVLVGGGGCDGGGDGRGPGERPLAESTPPADDSGVDSAPDRDADGDGHPTSEDCNDADPAVFPGAVDDCNGVDDDCSGTVDDGERGGATECVENLDGWFVQEQDAWHEDGHSIALSGDLDGDGLPDLLLGGPGQGTGFLHVFLNAEMWNGVVPTREARWTLQGQRGDWLATAARWSGRSADFLPDFDGDGRDEILVGATQSVGSPGRVYLVPAAALEYEYGDLPVTRVASLVLEDETGVTDGNGAGVVTLGDVDGDTIADVYVGARFGGWVVSGAMLTEEAPSLAGGIRVEAPTDYEDEYLFGRSATRGGDLDGDGIEEVLVTCVTCGERGTLSVFLGANLPSPGGSATVDEADATFRADDDHLAPVDLAANQDVDGDGRVDWALSSYYTGPLGGVWLYTDTLALLGTTFTTADALTHVTTVDERSFGESIVLGDFDADGLGDLAVEDSSPTVEYYTFPGTLLSAGGNVDSSSASRHLAHTEDAFAGGQLRATDWDGNGADDLIAADFGWSADGGVNGAGGAILVADFP